VAARRRLQLNVRRAAGSELAKKIWSTRARMSGGEAVWDIMDILSNDG